MNKLGKSAVNVVIFLIVIISIILGAVIISVFVSVNGVSVEMENVEISSGLAS